MFTRTGGVPAAGVMTRPPELHVPPFWAMYVGVPNLEDAATQIKRLGGSDAVVSSKCRPSGACR
jgi:predicted enzyme related to lactoylglutathione lyase